MSKYSETFSEFWEAFPRIRRTKKPKAYQSWQAAGLDDDPTLANAVIQNVRMRAAQDRQWLDGFAPMPTTYLNNEGWEDGWEQAEAKESSKPESQHAMLARMYQEALKNGR